MENMNLASRCRQVISEAADLKRKVAGYEKRHGDFGNLQKEVLLLRRQIERQHGGSVAGSSGVEKSSSNSRRNRSTSPKGVKRSNNGGDAYGASSSSSNTLVDEKKKKKKAVTNGSLTSIETKNSTETTDLDRIMAQELFKKNGATAAAASNAGSGGGGGRVSDGDASVNAVEKKDGNTNAMMKKFEELNISTTANATNSSNTTISANTKSGGGSKVAALTTVGNNATSASKRSNTTTITSSGSDGVGNSSNSNNNNISSANTKIPISVATSSATQKDDDEFDAEIDMVGFFAKSSQTKLGATSSASVNISSDSSGADGVVPPSSNHSRSHITHKLKKTETDDHMPEELVGSADLLSPSNKSSSEKNVGDNLLSSLDAFEASFASAFPETSFSIKSEVPSTTQLDMSFDVPVFDPFFKSPVNKDRDGASTSSSLHQTPPKSKSSMSGVPSGSGNSNAHKDGMKSQLKDLFPESALTTSPKRGLDLTFDSTFPDVDIGSGSSSSSNANKSGKGKSALSADKLDSAFSRAHATTTTSTKTAGGSSTGGGGGKSLSSNRPPPLDMSAEIEQLDALASANTEKTDGGERKRSVRKVKTPLSYAEPSISQKLRRGDVLFPKIDADRKLELEAKRSKSGGDGTTDLDRIMSEHFSNSNNTKKDGAAPS